MSNYDAIIAKITEVQPIPKSDFIQSAKVLGEWVIVKTDLNVGDVGVFFTVGSALSERMCFHNDLYRDASKNSNPESTGFLENNGRIIALKLRGAISAGLFLPLSSLGWVGKEAMNLQVGTQFAKLGKHEIASRYNPPIKRENGSAKTSKKGKIAAEYIAPHFHKHIDTAMFKRTVSQISKGSVLYFHNKRHGTSSRVGKTKVELNLPAWKRAVNKFINVFPTEEYRIVVGSRNVIVTNRKDGFYGSNDFRMRVAKQLEPFLSCGMTVYSEICGYVGGAGTIMPDHSVEQTKDKAMIKKYGKTIRYAYGCPEGQLENFIYRITITTDDGLTIDMPQKAMEAWCRDRELKCTYDVHEPIIYDGDAKALLSLVEQLTELPETLGEDPEFPGQLSEGIIIREEGDTMIPKFYKSKNFWFRLLEGHNVYADLEEES